MGDLVRDRVVRADEGLGHLALDDELVVPCGVEAVVEVYRAAAVEGDEAVGEGEKGSADGQRPPQESERGVTQRETHGPSRS